MDLSLPVTYASIGSMKDTFSQLSDLRNIGVAIGLATIHSLQAYIKCTYGWVAAILDILLPVTSNNVESRGDRFSLLSDLWIMEVAIGISTNSLPAYIQCIQGLAAAILGLPLPVTSNNIYSNNDKPSELNDLGNIGVTMGRISAIYSLEDETHKPALKVDRPWVKPQKSLCRIGISSWYIHQKVWKW